MAQLVIVTGPQQGTCYRLQARPLTAGRDPVSEIQIVDVKVSRRHFMVVPTAGGYTVRELKSTNGVQVNHVRIQGEQALIDGDVIGVGDTQLLFSVQDDADAADALRKFRKVDKELRERSTEREG